MTVEHNATSLNIDSEIQVFTPFNLLNVLLENSGTQQIYPLKEYLNILGNRLIFRESNEKIDTALTSVCLAA